MNIEHKIMIAYLAGLLTLPLLFVLMSRVMVWRNAQREKSYAEAEKIVKDLSSRSEKKLKSFFGRRSDVYETKLDPGKFFSRVLEDTNLDMQHSSFLIELRYARNAEKRNQVISSLQEFYVKEELFVKNPSLEVSDRVLTQLRRLRD